MIGSWESSGVVTIHPLHKWYHMGLCHTDWWTPSDALVDVYLWRRASPLCSEYNSKATSLGERKLNSNQLYSTLCHILHMSEEFSKYRHILKYIYIFFFSFTICIYCFSSQIKTKFGLVWFSFMAYQPL